MPTVVCEKHGLRFDPDSQAGCLVCRREAAPIAPPSLLVAAAPGETGLAKPLAVAVSIWLVSAFVLFAAHREIARAYVLEQEEAAIETEVDAAAPPGAERQADAVLQEFEASERERAASRENSGAPFGLPNTQDLSQDAGRLEQVERTGQTDTVSSEPVTIELDDGTVVESSSTETTTEPPPLPLER